MSNYAKLAASATPQNKPKTKRPLPPQCWKPGQSGNPGGRPKSKPITEMLRVIFDDPDTVSKIRENVKRTLTDKGMAGVILLSHVTDRLEGKMPDEVTINDTRSLTDEELEEKLEALRAARK